MKQARQNTETRVIALIAEILHKNPQDIDLSQKIDDLAQDSIELFGLITAFEDAFGVETEYDELIHIKTVGDIVTYLDEHTNKKHSS